MSDTLQQMLVRRLGYRTESYSGSGVRDLRAVLEHELSVLRNTDILFYCKKHYFSDFVIFQGNQFSKPLAVDADGDVERIEQLVRRRLRTNRRLYGLWLTTKDNVCRFYGGIDEDIDCYAIPQNTFVLSDLGPEGTLFVYQKHPRHYMKATQQKKKHSGVFHSLWKQWFAGR